MKRHCLGYPGYDCGRLISGASRCVTCQRAFWRRREQFRDPSTRRLYASSAWRRLADAVVTAADRCATCGAPKATTRLTGGHIAGIRERPDLALEPGNVIAQCRSCQERMKHEPNPRKWR